MMIHSEYLVLKVPEAVIIHSRISYHKVILCYGISLRMSGEIVENNAPFSPLTICRLTTDILLSNTA